MDRSGEEALALFNNIKKTGAKNNTKVPRIQNKHKCRFNVIPNFLGELAEQEILFNGFITGEEEADVARWSLASFASAHK